MTGRYKKSKKVRLVDSRGREVVVTGLRPAVPRPKILGHHLVRDGERIDHLAHGYLGDSTRHDRIVDANGAMSREQIEQRRTLAIPDPRGSE